MTVKTLKMGPGDLSIGSDTNLTNFASQVKSVRVVPEVDTGDDEPVLSGEVIPGDRTESWTLSGTLKQDFGAADSTTEWLFEHRGEQHPFTYIPSTSAGRQVTGELVVEAIEIGGDVSTKPDSDFEFRLVGPPQLGAVTGT
mgnify:CR=1 FL=1